ncbi:hypothetical protein C1H46_033586 [Malus baccata]|uniref:DUF2828 domain-containing protein n=1 Tax=Malus baccata TaxID=106549 RepID=A0A540L2W7_MALBA|nr:hypothetical protein C1H46_033586 [Malus baccata]
MAPPSLLGPPELRTPTPPPQPQPAAPSGNPFVDLMVANYNDAAKVPVIAPPMGYTENGASTFLNSGNPCVDFFFHVVPTTPASYFNTQLPLAWAHDDLTTLKLICNLRGVRGTGKSDKEGFYTAAFWLHKHHPKTLACNVASFAEFGYFKDLPEILYRLLEGEEVRKKQKAEWNIRKNGSGRTRRDRRMRGHARPLRYKPPPSPYDNSPFYSAPHQHPWGLKPPFSGGRGRKSSNRKYGRGDEQSKEARIQLAKERAQLEKEKASLLRKEKKAAMAKKAIVRYQRDPDFRCLKLNKKYERCCFPIIHRHRPLPQLPPLLRLLKTPNSISIALDNGPILVIAISLRRAGNGGCGSQDAAQAAVAHRRPRKPREEVQQHPPQCPWVLRWWMPLPKLKGYL